MKTTLHTCEETTGMVGDDYIRCGAPASRLIQPIGRSEGPYWMCDPCASHNVRNRHCADVTPPSGSRSLDLEALAKQAVELIDEMLVQKRLQLSSVLAPPYGGAADVSGRVTVALPLERSIIELTAARLAVLAAQ